MAEKHVHGDKVHVVVGAGHVAIGVQRGLVAREVEFFIGGRDGGRHGRGVLLGGEPAEMGARALVPAQRVAGVGRAPAEQLDAPRDGSVHEGIRLVIPDRVGRHADGGSGGIDIRIRRLDAKPARQAGPLAFGRVVELFQIDRTGCRGLATAGVLDAQENRRAREHPGHACHHRCRRRLAR